MNRRLILAAVAALTALFALPSAAASAAPMLSFDEITRAQPVVHKNDLRFDYTIKIKNVGDATTSGSTILSFKLPDGVELGEGGLAGSGLPGNWVCKPSSLLCSNSQAVAPGASFAPLELKFWPDPAQTPDSLSMTFTIFGGGSSGDVIAVEEFDLAPAVPFGISSLAAVACSMPAGAPDASLCGTDFGSAEYPVAGAHPYAATASFHFTTRLEATNYPGESGAPTEDTKNIVTELPAGFIGNPEAAGGICTYDEVVDEICPASAAVGGIDVDTAYGDVTGYAPLYRIAPEDGYVAAFAWRPLIFAGGGPTLVLRAKLRARGDYGVTAIAPLAPMAPRLTGVRRATLCSFGAKVTNPHGTGFQGCKAPTDIDANPIPFLSNPTRCAGDAPVTEVRVDSWVNPGTVAGDGLPDPSDPNWKTKTAVAPEGTDCEPLTEAWAGVLSPSFGFQPDSTRADAAAGYTANLAIPGGGLEDPNGVANSHLKDVRVVLPQGIALNPAAADNLGTCTLIQAGYLGNDFPAPNRIRFNTAAEGCPGNSKIATAEVRTPVLAGALPASVYLAAQGANPFGSDFGIYLVVDDPKTGVKATIPGEVEADSGTGQVTATFRDNPQAPISDVDIRFFGGARASLANPDVCASYSTTTEMSPWSAADPYDPQPDELATPGDTVTIDTPPAGQSSCAASKDQRPFAIAFEAGSLDILAGAYSPFTIRLQRPDGNQEFDRIEIRAPAGLTARLAGVPYCSEAQIAQAGARTATGDGSIELASPSCPDASKVGTTTVGAGAGPSPIYVKGNVYLAGPYKGAPVSFVFVIPAVSGPFDLGVQVVRTALNVDSTTAQVSATSDPIPQILRGVPLRVRDIRVDLDRPGFTLNPTDCTEQMVVGRVTGGSGAVRDLSNRFQVGNCGDLAFKPRVNLRLFGGTARAQYQGLRAVVRPRPGDANIAGSVIRFPSSAFVAQEHLKNICTRVQWAADACPKGSVYGSAVAYTPLLDQPLRGKVHLRSSDNVLPDLVADLRGPAHQPIRFELAVKTDSVKGALRSTVMSAPDAPVTFFRLQTFGGKKGLIRNSRNICKGKNAARVTMRAHNGRRSVQRVRVRNAKCPKSRKGHKRKAGKKRKAAAKERGAGAQRARRS